MDSAGPQRQERLEIGIDSAIDRYDPAAAEKKIESERSSTQGTMTPAAEIENVDDRLWLSDDEALERARSNPKDTRPVYIIFSPDDRDNPRNWSTAKKWYITAFASLLNVMTCLCAGGYSSGVDYMEDEFGVSSEVGTVGLSLYIFGFAVGPMLLAPLSEYYGRQPVYVWSWLLLVIFQMPVALAPDITVVLIFRFLQGLAGSAPLTNTGGTVSDLWRRDISGPAMSLYGASSTFGPPFALVISGYLAQNEGWRALFWAYMGIFGGVWILLAFTIPETRHSIILVKKANKVRKQIATENVAFAERIRDAHYDEKRSLHTLFSVTLTRPFRFLFTEPITMGAAAYNGFIYGLVYIFNESFPILFADEHGFNTGESGLSFLGICVGAIIGALIHPLQERYYLRRKAENNGKGVPEARLWMARGGAILLPLSLFGFAWTSFSSVPWIVPIIFSGFFGLAIFIVILSILNYVVDAYQTFSASSLAGVILVRNTVGAGFPLFATQMYDRLGLEWASSLLAFLSILMIPIPFIWFYKGDVLRLRSPFAREHYEQDEDAPH